MEVKRIYAVLVEMMASHSPTPPISRLDRSASCYSHPKSHRGNPYEFKVDGIVS